MAADKAQLTHSSNITWNGGQLFNGYCLLVMALPSTGGASWTKVCLKDCRPKLRVPTRVKVPIREGKYDADTQVWRTDSLVPPNIKYSAFYYDDTDRLISVGSELFTVEAAVHSLAPPVLTDPTAAVVSTNPEQTPTETVEIRTYGVPTREPVQGTKNGANSGFTISRVGTVVMLIWNQTVLTEGVHYSLAGTAITMVAPFLPDVGDTLEALIW